MFYRESRGRFYILCREGGVRGVVRMSIKGVLYFEGCVVVEGSGVVFIFILFLN